MSVGFSQGCQNIARSSSGAGQLKFPVKIDLKMRHCGPLMGTQSFWQEGGGISSQAYLRMHQNHNSGSYHRWLFVTNWLNQPLWILTKLGRATCAPVQKKLMVKTPINIYHIWRKTLLQIEILLKIQTRLKPKFGLSPYLWPLLSVIWRILVWQFLIWHQRKLIGEWMWQFLNIWQMFKELYKDFYARGKLQPFASLYPGRTQIWFEKDLLR